MEQARLEELRKRLDDPEFFYGELCGLHLEDHHDGFPWRDVKNPEDPYNYIDRFLDEPFDGKTRCVFGPRKLGKTISVAMPRVVRKILLQPDSTFMLGGEKATEVIKRSLWCRTRIVKAEEEFGYGPLVDGTRWAADEWTVLRKSGFGGQDTVTVGSPDKPGTSQHWTDGIFDDAVGEWAAKSAARMVDGVRWFTEQYNQAMLGTQMVLFGTLWPGKNIYRWIIETQEGGLRNPTRFGPGTIYRGKKFDIYVLTPYDKSTGKVVFGCYTPTYLDNLKEIIGDAMFKSQYLNDLLDNTELGFDERWFGGFEDLPDEPMHIYIVTDTATSTGRVRHTSISCILVVGVTPKGHAWLLDGRAGKMGWDNVPDTIIELAQKWSPYKIIHENTGPSKQLPKSLQDCGNVKKPGLGDFIRRLCKSVGRPTDKHFRIQSLIPHVQAGKLHFANSFAACGLFYIDRNGSLQGQMGREFSNYTYGADESYDCLDAAADIWGYDATNTPFLRLPKVTKQKTLDWSNPWEYIKEFYDKRMPIRDEDAS